MSDKAGRVLVEVTISAPIEQVWAALRDPQQITNWFGWDADTLKDEIDFIFLSEATRADAALHTIYFGEWEGVSDRFELVEGDGKTVLRVVRSAPADVLAWDEVYDDIIEGWIMFVAQLRHWIERHPGETRRTVFVAGKKAPDQHTPAMPVIPASVAGSVGDSYRAVVLGETISGTIWHRSRFQLGLTVSEWGNGLLVVIEAPPHGSSPNGSGSAVASTFGLPEASFEGLRQRLPNAWKQHYPE